MYVSFNVTVKTDENITLHNAAVYESICNVCSQIKKSVIECILDAYHLCLLQIHVFLMHKLYILCRLSLCITN